MCKIAPLSLMHQICLHVSLSVWLFCYVVGSKDRASSQQLQMSFFEHFFAPELAVTPIVSATLEQVWSEKMTEKPHSIRILR